MKMSNCDRVFWVITMIEIKGAYNSWNCSAPHGAGRIMSRKAAFKNLSMDEYREQMKGIFTTSVTKDTLDESPMAYKSIEAIVRHIRNLPGNCLYTGPL